MADRSQVHGTIQDDHPVPHLPSESEMSESSVSARPSTGSSHDSSNDPVAVVFADGSETDCVDSAPESLRTKSLDSPCHPFADGNAINLEHVIHLSSIEHCMPRAYIRICMSYRMPDSTSCSEVVQRLDNFVRKTVDAKPYLAGYVVPAGNSDTRIGAVEIRFSEQDYQDYPGVSVRHLTWEEVPYTYNQLDDMHLPPSVIKPDLVSALTESADENRAPVFRVQANFVRGGVIVSIYLHHCISDGTGIGLLISGSVLMDDFKFERYLDTKGQDSPSLSVRLATFANRKSVVRKELSWSDHNQINSRHLKCRVFNSSAPEIKPPAKGRGCVVAFSLRELNRLKTLLEDQEQSTFMTLNDVLQALLWHSMMKARIPSLASGTTVTTSKLLIPTNIRGKLKNSLPDHYFGAAIDFACAQMSLETIARDDLSTLVRVAKEIRRAINSVDEPYIRQAITVSMFADVNCDVRDLQASNMDRSNGADMYITSWEKLEGYESTLGLELGQPDWVRKPWSRDPGSCIVLPLDSRKDYLEVVIQMTKPDMERLLEDQNFRSYVVKVID